MAEKDAKTTERKCPACMIGNLFLIAEDENGSYFHCFNCGGRIAEAVAKPESGGGRQ